MGNSSSSERRNTEETSKLRDLNTKITVFRTYTDFADLEEDFKKEELYPKDLKDNLARYLNEILEPVRKHFQNNPGARTLFAQVSHWQELRKLEKKKKK